MTERQGAGEEARRPVRALTIAGSDSGGGAGIQADLKTFAALAVHGLTVLTAVTAQNSLEVQGVHLVPAEMVAQQLDSVLADIGAEAAKTGMLGSAAIVAVVAGKLRQYGLKHLVVDPVMQAASGDRLLQEEAVGRLREELLPLAAVVTPNLAEAEALVGFPVRDPAAMERAARELVRLGAQAAVVTGGHLEGEAVDVFFDGERSERLTSPRVPTADTHGTGCTFSAALTAELAKGTSLGEAVRRAKEFVTAALLGGYRLGAGPGTVDPMAGLVWGSAPPGRDAH